MEDENQAVQCPSHATDRTKNEQQGSCPKHAVEVAPEENPGQDRSGKLKAQGAVSAVGQKGGVLDHTKGISGRAEPLYDFCGGKDGLVNLGLAVR